MRCNLVGATLGLIAGLSALSIAETGRSQRAGNSLTTMEGTATPDGHALSSIDASQERDRTIAYYLNPGRTLISVRTDNYYEIETILEIFRGGGAIYLTHIADDGVVEGRPPILAADTMVHSRTNILGDRLRETA